MRFAVRMICCLTIVAGFATESFAGYAYLRSQSGGALWNWAGAPLTNEQAMNTAFGAGNWSDLRFETASVAGTFSAANSFIYLDGSDLGALELEAFLSPANLAVIENWVAAGGSLFINSAPNEDNGMSFGFGGVALNYGPGTSSGSAAAAAGQNGHAIFTTPSATGTNFTGGAFSHATVSGPGLTSLVVGTAGAVLAEKSWGLGHVMFGGMTITYFHDPDPQSFDLRVNILTYGASQANVGEPNPTPEPASMALLAMGVGGFACARKLRRRKAVDAAV